MNIRDTAHRIATLTGRELKSYFNSPIAYIVVIFFLGFTATWLFYIQQFLARNVASLRSYFAIIPSVFVILTPAITMRLWAEENRTGAAELLLTLPYRTGELVLGKFFGAIGLLKVMLLLTIPIPISVSGLGDFEIGQIVGQYIGVLLLGSACLAIGQFVSSFTGNQISAFLISAVILLFLSLISQVNLVLDLPRPLAAVITYLSLNSHFRSFEIGLIDTRDVLFYVSTVVLFLYLNTKVLIFRKWR